MRRFLLPRAFADGESYTAAGPDFHYLARVLRLEAGSEVPAGDSGGGSYRLSLVERGPDRLVFRVHRETERDEGRSPAAGAPELVLLQCLPKPVKMDLIVRMTTEAGVSRIAPLTSDWSAVKEREAGRLEERRRRWEKIARAAYEQSGRRTLPVIEAIGRLADVAPAGRAGEEIAFFADERGGEGRRALHGLLGAGPVKRARFVVGPEGGLSLPEREGLLAKGFAPVYLGHNILRTETAAPLVCAAINLLLLEKASWTTK